MTRFLNLASKALAVIGVLTLMWTAGGMQSAKADPDPSPYPLFTCFVIPIGTPPTACKFGVCEPLRCCCVVEGPVVTITSTFCCWMLCSPCA